MKTKRVFSLVVPFYNEGQSDDAVFDPITGTIEALDSVDFEIGCVDDGSKEDTLERLLAVSRADPRVKTTELSRSRGKEAALTDGLDATTGDAEESKQRPIHNVRNWNGEGE